VILALEFPIHEIPLSETCEQTWSFFIRLRWWNGEWVILTVVFLF